jgi:hypothetical protein
MTDLQTMVVMFARADVPYTIAPTRTDNDASANLSSVPEGTTISAVPASSETPRVFGYYGFVVTLYFDVDGALVGVGAWE